MPPIIKALELAAEAAEHCAPQAVEGGLNLLKVIGEKTGLSKSASLSKAFDFFKGFGKSTHGVDGVHGGPGLTPSEFSLQLSRAKDAAPSALHSGSGAGGDIGFSKGNYIDFKIDQLKIPKTLDQPLISNAVDDSLFLRINRGSNHSVAGLKVELKGIKSTMETAELPTSATPYPSIWKFIPERATELDAFELGVERPPGAGSISTEQGDNILAIKQYINNEGHAAHEYLSNVVNNSDITIIGEQHTLDAPNPHRVLGAKVVGELPPGSTLAVELPSSLKPVFEAFNRNHGGELQLPSPTDTTLSMQPALSLLKVLKRDFPEMIDLFKSARDRGVRVVPIDAEVDTSETLTSEARESKLSSELLALSDGSGANPVVGWLGIMHAAKTTERSVSMLAKRIAESPDFASGNRRLSTVLSQMSDEESTAFPLSVLAKNVHQPVGMPTRIADVESPLSKILIMSDAAAKLAQTDAKVSDFDHLILYPPTSPEALAKHYMRRAQALMSDATGDIGINAGFGEFLSKDFANHLAFKSDLSWLE